MSTLLRSIVFSVVILAVLGQLIKTVTVLAGISNPLPTIRDLALIGAAVLGLIAGDTFKSVKLLTGITLLLVTLFIYLLIAFSEGSPIEGLYFARIYILPVLFAAAMHGAVQNLSAQAAARVFQLVLAFGFALVASAIGIYIASLIEPKVLTSLMGDGELASAWYISGGTWMRMGLPATGPNSLGLILALNIMLLVTLMEQGLQKKSVWSMGFLTFSVIGLLLTFSRSSWLMLMTSLFFVYANRNLMGAIKGLFWLALGGLLLSAVALSILSVTDPKSFDQIQIWLELNLSGRDPSMQGHIQTFQDAWDDLEHYYLHGYPKGTVGPKAAMFTYDVNNIENSVLGLIYDMGLPLSALFLIGWGVLMSQFYVGRSQLAVLLGFFVCSQFLPYVFEADIMIYIVFIYALVGLSIRASRGELKSSWGTR